MYASNIFSCKATKKRPGQACRPWLKGRKVSEVVIREVFLCFRAVGMLLLLGLEESSFSDSDSNSLEKRNAS